MGLYVMLFTDAINLEMKEQLKKKEVKKQWSVGETESQWLMARR